MVSDQVLAHSAPFTLQFTSVFIVVEAGSSSPESWVSGVLSDPRVSIHRYRAAAGCEMSELKHGSFEVGTRHHASLRSGYARPASPSTRLAIATTSAAPMSRMQRWSFTRQTGRWQGWQGRLIPVWTV